MEPKDAGATPKRWLKRGIELLAEQAGDGEAAQKGDRALFNLRLFLHRGDEVPLNEVQIEALSTLPTREVDGVRVLDRSITLGRREAIAGIEQALLGMRAGGYRRVRISPHLAYRDAG